jgi:predicted ester cyclase
MYIEKETDMTDPSRIAATRRVAEEFIWGVHTGDLDVIDRTVAETLVCHGFPGGNPTSRATYKAWFAAFGASFSNMGFEVLSTVADEEKVAMRWRVSVDHTGPFAGVDPTGKRVVFDGMVLYRVENGLIAETWLHINELSLLGQVGALIPLAA